METFVFAAPNTLGSVVVLPSTLHPILTTGQTYYLYGLEPENAFNVWNYGTPTGTLVLNASGGPYRLLENQALPAFRIQVNTAPAAVLTPESSDLANMSIALLALGLSGLVMAVKKKKAKTSA